MPKVKPRKVQVVSELQAERSKVMDLAVDVGELLSFKFFRRPIMIIPLRCRRGVASWH